MNQESRATLEKIAPTAEEAIEQGLHELGLSRDQVEIEILDEGSKGLFGLGNRQARVRLTLKSQTMEDAPTPVAKAPVRPKAVEQEDEDQDHDFEDDDDDYDFDDDDEDDDDDYDFDDDDDDDEDEEDDFDDGKDYPLDLENVSAIAKATVLELLEKMNLPRTTVEATILQPDDEHDRPGVHLNILGGDLSILIGKQAETLNALQYITRLIVGKEIGHGVNLMVDVEGYRTRREQNLRHLARRMASQAVKTGRKQMLEPMPANERRIIHIELRDNDEVTTESVGEEPRRKVTIIPNP
jgi:spoIIIJ-associated protein